MELVGFIIGIVKILDVRTFHKQLKVLNGEKGKKEVKDFQLKTTESESIFLKMWDFM